MGASYRDGTLPFKGNRSHDKVRAYINEEIESDIIEFGIDPYSGHLGTKQGEGIVILDGSVRKFEQAEDRITEEAEKVGPILVLKVSNNKNPYWYYGCWCRS